MKAGFYYKLAITGMHKNKKLYLPYILTCIGMVMMYYIVAFLSETQILDYIRGGNEVQSMLKFGTWVIAVFAVIFLFYTNSFLIRRRKKEFGIYNILGMDKKNIGHILFWETVIVAAVALIIGLLLGILLSKMAELGLINMLRGDISYQMHFSAAALVNTCVLFCFISLIIFLGGLKQIHTANPIALLHSENLGEKPPKANWFLGIAGAVILASAYYIAVSIENPLSALLWFFVAVIMVVIATYILFVAGSVVLCRMLQKKKNYYYKANHFVSVSSMTYRMKRNGAGLASICILGTMVLVMITGSACLYFGSEDSLHARYPNDIGISIGLDSVEDTGDDNIEMLKKEAETVLLDSGVEITNSVYYRKAVISGLISEDEMETDASKLKSLGTETYDNVRMISFIPLSDYNRLMGTNEHLDSDEAMIYTVRCEYDYDTFTIKNGKTFEIVKTLDSFVDDSNMAMNAVPSIVIVVRDLDETLKPLLDLKYNGERTLSFSWYYGIDTGADAETETKITQQIYGRYKALYAQDLGGIYSYSCESLEDNREDFYGTYGGLFFLGIMLSIVFIAAATLIIYYKQISEGYEDRSRFEIMQKVGMTKKDIRKSINSQMLTVFFIPLLTAVIHLAFAFPLIYKLLMLFNLRNLPLLLLTACISVIIFALFYVIVYRITSNAYYKIVSGSRE